MLKNIKKQNAQGSIEYLLIMGAAILVVAIIIVAITTIIPIEQEDTINIKLLQECQHDCMINGGLWSDNKCYGTILKIEACQEFRGLIKLTSREELDEQMTVGEDIVNQTIQDITDLIYEMTE